MLNKELLLMNNGREIPKEWYTHVLTVGRSYTPSYSYGYHEQEGYGSLSPDTVSDSDSTKILTLETSDDASGVELVVDGFLEASSYLVLARADTEVNLGQASYGNTEFGIASWYAPEPFINERDLGKRIPIWLSTEQPPWDSAQNQSGSTTDTEK